MANVKIRFNLSRYKIEMKAREYGMEYQDDQKVIEKTPAKNIRKGDGKND